MSAARSRGFSATRLLIRPDRKRTRGATVKVPDIKVTPPGPKAKEIIERDHSYIATTTKSAPVVVKRASGSIVEDVDGNILIDFAAGISVLNVGHAHPKVVEAISRQASQFTHFAGTDFYYEIQATLVVRPVLREHHRGRLHEDGRATGGSRGRLRRARPRRRRVHRAAPGLDGSDRQDRQGPRRPSDRRRSPVRPRPDRKDVGDRTLGGRPGHLDDG